MSYQTYYQEKKKIISLISSQQCHAFQEIKEMIDKIMQKQVKLPIEIKYTLRDNIEKITNLLMLVLIFSLDIEHWGKTSERQQFSKIKSKKNCYLNIFLWINQQQKDAQEKIVQFILQYYGSFLSKKFIYVKVQDFGFLISIFNNYEIKRQRNIDRALSLISNFQQLKVFDSDFQTKQIAILRIICDVLAHSKSNNSNLGLLVDDLVISNSKDIDRFCSYYDYMLAQYSSAAMLNICKGLCISGFSPNCLKLIYNLSRILANYQEFQKLKSLYQTVILPFIIKTGKKCVRDGVHELIYKIAKLYIYGFFTCCDIGQKGIDLLLNDVDIVSENSKNRWIQLAFVASQHGNHSNYVLSSLQKLKIPQELIKEVERKEIKIKGDIWQVNSRSICERKVYLKRQSTFSGISNKGSQCYIITVVQALFMTKKLYQLLQQKFERIDRKRKIALELKSLFGSLSNQKQQSKISVDQLQQQGPAQFAESKHQEDAHQYLMALFDQLERELKAQKYLKQFKQIFQIQIKEIVTCTCGNIIYSSQSQYMHTISHLEPIRLKMEEQLTDFTCQKCSKKKCKKKIQLNLKGDIFIVHLNRFSVKDGITKKQLSTSNIPRKINNYSLIGMIIHIGKNVQCGHYVYYSRIDTKNWVQFNDNIVKQFTLYQEDQEFERELRQENTPYILFYKKERIGN